MLTLPLSMPLPSCRGAAPEDEAKAGLLMFLQEWLQEKVRTEWRGDGRMRCCEGGDGEWDCVGRVSCMG